MRIVPENHEDLLTLVEWYGNGLIEAELYYQAVDDYASLSFGTTRRVIVERTGVDLR